MVKSPEFPLPNSDGEAAAPTGSRECLDVPKLPLHLIPPEAEEAMARTLQYGATKYATRNWEKGLYWAETVGSLRRHLLAFTKGELRDHESGLLHTDHIITNAAFLCTMVERRPDLNDFPWSQNA